MRWLLVLPLLVGCFSKPGFHGNGGDDDVDSGTSGPHTAPAVRFVRNAYYSGNSRSSGMTSTGFSISTNGIAPGELVILIADVDNGGPQEYPPMAGFTQLTRNYWGAGIDGQSFMIAWKIASAMEPATYDETYGDGGSGATTVTMLAATGFDPEMPLGPFSVNIDTAGSTMPDGWTAGVTTEIDHSALVYVNGADWLIGHGNATFTIPNGFTELTEFGDNGNTGFDWSTQEVAWKVAADAGTTGPVTAKTTAVNAGGAVTGYGIGALLSIRPVP